MPILSFECPDCRHTFKGTILLGTKPPAVWICSQCKSERPTRRAGSLDEPHPWETAQHAGCLLRLNVGYAATHYCFDTKLASHSISSRKERRMYADSW
jgi:hypothetical protein